MRLLFGSLIEPPGADPPTAGYTSPADGLPVEPNFTGTNFPTCGMAPKLPSPPTPAISIK
ncbi:hypothetical protein K503DRAFT_86375 [Rhizopogon vinicolor AM-OR11-026]|uniref:Uncharacterized protein n=1 Tax=Rhizopogon vinicolor AM-OR11-026 TaxID=1314800 RepID=A0A1B7N3K2_9AGAM|nr:hypothetical protein K503DRAFT_86375 [Rhizopogon vinicolor AM-OR11-026]